MLAGNTLARTAVSLLTVLVSFLVASTVSAQQQLQLSVADQGRLVFESNCAVCHNGSPNSPAPTIELLASLPPETILRALNEGVMRYQGYELLTAEKNAVALYLSDKPFSVPVADSNLGQCKDNPGFTILSQVKQWNGYGPAVTNTAFQSTEAAGLTADSVAQLELKWAFGFPVGSSSAWSTPSIVSDRVFVGSHADGVYSLDAKSGCTYWHFSGRTGVRTAPIVAQFEKSKNGQAETYAVYFGDMMGYLYAIDAQTGEPLWETLTEEHSKVRITGTPVLHGGVLYVPVSSFERGFSSQMDYECCTFRGSVLAVDAATGAILWKTYLIPDQPQLTSRNEKGIDQFGPAGAAVWMSPTVDVERGLVYISGGNSYTTPSHSTTDSVVALNMQTGEPQWIVRGSSDQSDNSLCQMGESFCSDGILDYPEFATTAMLATHSSARQLVIIGQKSGLAWALDPDQQGKPVWQYSAGRGGGLGGIEWGIAADEKNVYIPVSDNAHEQAGGLHAIDLLTGERRWVAPPPSRFCGARTDDCSAAQVSAIAVIPGVIFSGSNDGGIRAYSTDNGSIIWQFDTNRQFATVNGIAANGGSLMAAGPTVVDGMLFVNSGYSTNGSRPGNVLLAFGIRD